MRGLQYGHFHTAPSSDSTSCSTAMFNTLRQPSTGDPFYILEPAATPFNKKRHGRLARIACFNCRATKLKCTGNPSGCARCEAKHLKCKYPGRSSNTEASESKKQPSEASKRPTTPGAKSPDFGGSEDMLAQFLPGLSPIMDMTGSLDLPTLSNDGRYSGMVAVYRLTK